MVEGEPGELKCHHSKSGLKEEELGLDESGLDSISLFTFTIALGSHGYLIREVTSHRPSVGWPPNAAPETESPLPSIAIGTDDLRFGPSLTLAIKFPDWRGQSLLFEEGSVWENWQASLE